MINPITNRIAALRARVDQGDASAIRECQADFGPSVRRIVRHMLRTGRFDGEIGAFVRATAERMQRHSQLDREELVTRVTSQICEAMSGVGAAGAFDTHAHSTRATFVCS